MAACADAWHGGAQQQGARDDSHGGLRRTYRSRSFGTARRNPRERAESVLPGLAETEAVPDQPIARPGGERCQVMTTLTSFAHSRPQAIFLPASLQSFRSIYKIARLVAPRTATIMLCSKMDCL